MRAFLLALTVVVACTRAPAPASAPSGSCVRDADCPVVMGAHQPCCFMPDDGVRCATLPPKADACPGLHACAVDGDCASPARCLAYGAHPGARTCQGAPPSTGKAIPGECMNLPPNAPLPPACRGL